jgi:hypothetical protein
VGTRVVLVVYFLVAAVAAFVTAARTLSLPLLLGVLLALGIVATLLRARLIGEGSRSRATIGFIAVYLITFFALTILFRR